MKNILPEKEGAPVSIYEVLQYSQFKHHGARKNDVLFIVYRDEKNKKKVRAITDPDMEIFFLNPEERGKFFTPREYIEKEKVYPVIVPAKQVVNRIHTEMQGATDPQGAAINRIWNHAIRTGNFRAKKEVFKWPYVFMADMNVEDYYRVMLGYHYNTMHGHVINKCFLDIENDIYKLSYSEQQANLDPTNACTLIFHFDKFETGEERPPMVFTFLLRNHKRYPQQKDFEDRLDEFYDTLHKHFDHQTIIKDDKEVVVDTTARYKILFYDDERDLLKAIFDTINLFKPDLCEVWNIAYDLPKLKGRMEHFGMDHVSIMCDDIFPKDCQLVEMNIDNRPGVDIADRKTYIRMASTTIYLDQMQTYAGIRKGRKAYGSNKLDNIAKIELGMGKWEFAKGIDVTNAAIKDYWNFVLYNIRDVWCQYLIDIATNDSMTVIYDMNQSNCPAQNLTKQTKYQKQIYYTWYLRKGVIPGDNPNVDYIKFDDEDIQEEITNASRRRKLRLDADGDDLDEEDVLYEDEEALDETEESMDDEDKLDEDLDELAGEMTDGVIDVFKDSVGRKLPLPGGLVGNPNFNSPNGTELIEGVPSKHVFDEAMDEDFASEYPWAKFTRSMSKSTQIGRLIIPDKISERQNQLPLGQQKRAADVRQYIPGAEFTSDYISQDWLSFGEVWFGLPPVNEVAALIKEMAKKDGSPIFDDDGKDDMDG